MQLGFKHAAPMPELVPDICALGSLSLYLLLPHFFPNTQFGNWEDDGLCLGDWPLLASGGLPHTKELTLALVFQLPQGMGWGWAGIRPARAPLSVYLGERGPCGWLSQATNAQS